MAKSFQQVFKDHAGMWTTWADWDLGFSMVQTTKGPRLALMTRNLETQKTFYCPLGLEDEKPTAPSVLADLIDAKLQLALISLRDIIRHGVGSNG